MIIIETDRIYSVYVRSSKRIQWRYAEYGGRWETVEKAIEKAKEHCDIGTEYIVESLDGVEMAHGIIG